MGRQKKSIKKPGSQIPLKLKENEPDHIVDWFNAQGTIADSIRYLIEKDIAENGIRDLTYEMKQRFSYYKPSHKIANESSHPVMQNEVMEQNSLNNNDSNPAVSSRNDDIGSSGSSVLPVDKEQEKPKIEEPSLSPVNINQEKSKEKKIIEEVTGENDDDLDIDDLNIFG